MKFATRPPKKRRKPPQVEAQLDQEERRGLKADLSPGEARRASIAVAGKSQGRRGSPSPHQAKTDPLHGISCSINAVLDLGRLMKTILDQSLRLLHAERGILFLGNPESVGLVPVMAVNLRGEEIKTIDRVSRTVLNLAKGGITTITADALSDPRLGPGFGGDMVVGTGIDEEVLRRAGVEQADVLIAVTNGDNTNAMAAQVAKEIFGVPRVICRIYDHLREEIYRELGLETICPTLLSANQILKNLAL